MVKTITLVRGDTHYGPHAWDDEAGIVRGIHGAELNHYGTVAWQHAPTGIGSSKPALHDNDSMIAMLLMLGFEVPAELDVVSVPQNTDVAGIVN